MKGKILLTLLCTATYVVNAQFIINDKGQAAIGTKPSEAGLTLKSMSTDVGLSLIHNSSDALYRFEFSKYGKWGGSSNKNCLQLMYKATPSSSIDMICEYRPNDNKIYFDKMINVYSDRFLIDEHTGFNNGKGYEYILSGYPGIRLTYQNKENNGYSMGGIFLTDYGVRIWSGRGSSSIMAFVHAGTRKNVAYINSTGQLVQSSDARNKKNVKRISGSLQKIQKLEGKTYKFVNDEESSYNKKLHEQYKKGAEYNVGFLAQELELILPELVETDSLGEKYVNYIGIIPYLVEAIKEQQSQIDELQTLIKNTPGKKHNRVQSLKKDSDNEGELNNDIETDMDSVYEYETLLYQNSPNPFSQSTQIEFSLSPEVTNAMICIYNMNGSQLKCYHLENCGNGFVTIDGCELRPGMYMYSLIADGLLIDTKRMVLTE